MQRQRDGELVPIAEAFSDLSGPVAALREATPQALHHYTRFDQVNQLVSASEADPDRGFMARTMALCSLPRSNPGNRKEYKRVNDTTAQPPLSPRKQLSPSDRPGAVQGAKRRSEPLTARTDLGSLARGKRGHSAVLQSVRSSGSYNRSYED